MLTYTQVVQLLHELALKHPEEEEKIKHLREYIEDLQDRILSYDELFARNQGWTLD
jgi:hypothetical protein